MPSYGSSSSFVGHPACSSAVTGTLESASGEEEEDDWCVGRPELVVVEWVLEFAEGICVDADALETMDALAGVENDCVEEECAWDDRCEWAIECEWVELSDGECPCPCSTELLAE